MMCKNEKVVPKVVPKSNRIQKVVFLIRKSFETIVQLLHTDHKISPSNGSRKWR